MKILALDSSGLVASVAVVEEDRLLAEYTVNDQKTHSETLLPMIEEILRMLHLEPSDLQAIALADGPGSFTGLRIGAATAKGLALSLDIPLIPVPTLDALAYNLFGVQDRVVVPILDARRGQVYTGVYRFQEGQMQTLLPAKPMAIEELAAELNGQELPALFLGDGVPVHQEYLNTTLHRTPLYAPLSQARQRAASVGALAQLYAAAGRTVSPDTYTPNYMRLSQAERERLAQGKPIVPEDPTGKDA